MQILVTGAGGFIGNYFAHHLTLDGHTVFATYRNTLPEGISGDSEINLVKADLCGNEPLPAPLDAIVHCAADHPSTMEENQQLFDNNALSIQHLCQHANSSGVYNIIHCSSMSVYGQVMTNYINEETESVSPGQYGLSKLYAEKHIDEWVKSGNDRSATSIRLPGVVGKNSHGNFLSSVVESIRQGKNIVAHSPDAEFNNIVHVKDLYGFIKLLLEKKTGTHEITNIAATNPMPLGKILDMIIKLSGKNAHIQYQDTNRKPFLISLDKVQSLGYKPQSVKRSIECLVADKIEI